MNRTEKITGACMALLAAAALGQFYLDNDSAPQPSQARKETPVETAAPVETRPVTVDEAVSAGLSGFEEKDAAGRLTALGAVVEELESPQYATAKLSPETSELLAKAGLIELTAKEGVIQDDGGVLGRLTGVIAGRGHGEGSRGFTIKVITEGPQDLREVALKGVGKGGVGGKAVFEAVTGLAKTGGAPVGIMAGALRRTGGKKAAEPLTQLLRSTDDWKSIGACAVALQDLQDPQHMGVILERLEQIGLLDKPKVMPWLSGELFSAYMTKAEGSGFGRGIKLLRYKPSFVSRNSESVVKGLDSSEPETRRLAAVAVREAVVHKSLDPLKAQEMLTGRLDRETEPVLKAELTGSMDSVRRALDEVPQETKQ